jgi:hypothetical protein
LFQTRTAPARQHLRRSASLRNGLNGPPVAEGSSLWQNGSRDKRDKKAGRAVVRFARDRGFESTSLQRGVSCEPHFRAGGVCGVVNGRTYSQRQSTYVAPSTMSLRHFGGHLSLHRAVKDQWKRPRSLVLGPCEPNFRGRTAMNGFTGSASINSLASYRSALGVDRRAEV